MKQMPFQKKYLQYLKPYHLEEISPEYVSVLSFKRNEFLFLEGEELHYLYIVIQGKAKVVFTMENGKTMLFSFYTDAGMIGDIEFTIDNHPAYNTVQVLTDFICLGIKLPLAKEYLMSQNAFLQEITKGLAYKLMQSNRNDALMILSPLEERLCSYLYMSSENNLFQERLTETSELLGTSYRHLLRTLEHLCQIQVLEHITNGYRILNLEYLKQHGGKCYHLILS